VNCKPMLAADCGGVETLTFPLVISPKLDGVRAIKSPECLLSRSLKPIPNKHVQALYDGLPDGLDGELLAGEATAPDVYRKTVSMVMSDDKPVDGLTLHVFDIQRPWPWEERAAYIDRLFADWTPWCPGVAKVPQVTVWNPAGLTALELRWVDEMGYEGLIARRPGSPYKRGRSTVKEGFLLKVKRFQDGEAVVIGVTELMHNQNAAMTNELGRTARSHKKAGLQGAGVMGTLVVRDVKTKVEFEIGTGFTAEDRAELWRQWWATGSVGKLPDWSLVKYKHFPSGAKDKPRHPVFLGWRDSRDI
jgi:DNA ligase 1